MNKFFALTIVAIFSAAVLTGCQKKPQPLPESATTMEYPEAEPDMDGTATVPHEQPVSSSTDPEVMEKELDGTMIMEEDFSDL